MNWRPMSELTEELQDGREVLLWCPDLDGFCVVGEFHDYCDKWATCVGFLDDNELTHFCKINPPEVKSDAN